MVKRKDELIYTINNKKYLLVEILITRDSTQKLNRLTKLGAIQQGVKEIHKTLFDDNYAILKYLIPTSKIDEYNKL
jgi:hypothetical protein